MDTNDKHIVAIDLGTSKIALTVAKIYDDDIQIIYYKETPAKGMRYSCVFNESNVGEQLSSAIKEAEEQLGIKITQAVVGMPKYSVRQETTNATINNRGEDTDITSENVATLKDFALSLYPLEDESKEAIFGAVAQSFSDGENFQIIEEEIVGMSSDTLEGNFKIFIGKKSDLRKIDKVMVKNEIAAMRKYFTAESTAKAVLTDSEMESGVALIDFGGGSTSVSVYHGNVMRHYASIPFGGKNITQDIRTECQITESLAENIKIAYGACMPDKLQSLSDKIIYIKGSGADPDKQLPVKYLSEIITARVEEIIMAILYEIEGSGFADMLRSGIVVTGGCARMANLSNFIFDISGFKTRIGYPKKSFSYMGCESFAETSSATSAGLILAASKDQTVNCTVEAAERRILTEIEIEHGNDTEDTAGVGVAGTEDNPQGKIWEDKDIEKVENPEGKTVKKRRSGEGISVKFTKIKKSFEEIVVEPVIKFCEEFSESDPNEKA